MSDKMKKHHDALDKALKKEKELNNKPHKPVTFERPHADKMPN